MCPCSRPFFYSMPRGFDVFVLFLSWVLLQSLSGNFMVWLNSESSASATLPPAVSEPAVQKPDSTILSPEDRTRVHPVVTLMERGFESPHILLVAFISVVIAAPMAEEFLCRFALQRWLARFGGLVSVVVTALVFAAAHGGTHETDISVDLLYSGLLGLMWVNLLFPFLGMGYLRWRHHVGWRDFGLADFRADRDIFVPLGLILLIAPALMVLQSLLFDIFPPHIQTDPIPIFVLGLVLSIVAHKTERILPCVMLHAFFNLFSFVSVVLVVLLH